MPRPPFRAARWCLVFLGAALAAAAAAESDATRAGVDFFENKIRPVLINRCFKCHSSDRQEGKLRLDRAELLLAGGRSGRVVLAGDPSGSLLIRAIRRVNKDLQCRPRTLIRSPTTRSGILSHG